MGSRPDDRYAATLRRAREDPRIVGLYLGGSRGKGAATELSDYDCDIVVDDDAAAEYGARLRVDDSGFSLGVFGLSEFHEHAAWGSPTEWNRYNYAHLTAAVDKLDGEIQRIIDDKATLPDAVARARLPGTLDGYINFVYRSLKNHRDGRALAARLDAAESIPLALGVLFMSHRRLRPYNKYLEWELTRWPLEGAPWNSDHLLGLLSAAAAGEVTAQRALYGGVTAVAARHGLAAVIEGWSPDARALLEGGG
jgi:hypothetical protein